MVIDFPVPECEDSIIVLSGSKNEMSVYIPALP
jgi:hypothetical protein